MRARQPRAVDNFQESPLASPTPVWYTSRRDSQRVLVHGFMLLIPPVSIKVPPARGSSVGRLLPSGYNAGISILALSQEISQSEISSVW